MVKSGSAQSEYEVNGITGATLTSNGVDAMIKNGLGAYITFISAGNAQNAAACDKACEGKKCEKAEKCADCTKECKDKKAACPKSKECKNKK